jgi:hypothetical protein
LIENYLKLRENRNDARAIPLTVFLWERAFAAAWAAGSTLTPEAALAAIDSAGSLSTLEDADTPFSHIISLPAPPEGIKSRQLEVLLLVTEGLSNVNGMNTPGSVY